MSSLVAFVLFIAFACGVAMGGSTSLGVALPLVFIVGGITLWVYRYHSPSYIKTLTTIVLIVCIGLSYSSYINSRQKEIDSTLPYYMAVDIKGKVSEVSSVNDYGRCRVKINGISSPQLKGLHQLYALHSYIDSSRNVKRGDSVKVRSLLIPINAAFSPDEVDYSRIFRADGVIGTINGDDMDIIPSPEGGTTLRERIINSINTYLDKAGLTPYACETIRALLIGDKQDMSSGLKSSLADTGVIHLFTVSGMHVAMIAFMMWNLLFFLRGRKIIRSSLVVASLFFYGYLTAWEAPVTRAVWMFAIITLASANPERGNNSLSALGIAGILYLILFPNDISNAGFAMSYTATAAIIIFYKRYGEWKKRMPRIPAYFTSVLCTTLCAQVALLPFILYYFGGFNLLFPLTNLLMIPYVTLYLFPFSALVVIMAIFGVKWEWVYGVYETSCEWIYGIIERAAMWDEAMVRGVDIDLWGAVALAMMIWGALVYVVGKRKMAAYMVVLGVVISLAGSIIKNADSYSLLCYDRNERMFYIENSSHEKIPCSYGRKALASTQTLCMANDWRYEFPDDDNYVLVTERFFYPETKPAIVVTSPYTPYSDMIKWKKWCDKHNIVLHDMKDSGYYVIYD